MDDDTNRIYAKITESYEQWAGLPEELHLLCPKISDEDEEDYSDPGPQTITGITLEEKQKRMQDFEQRTELTYDLSLLLGISKEQSGGWIEQWTERIEKFLTNCDACILGYHMHRKVFLKKLLE